MQCGSGVTHLLDILELGVGMGLMLSIFACTVLVKKRKSDLMHSGLIDCVSSCSIIDLNDIKR